MKKILHFAQYYCKKMHTTKLERSFMNIQKIAVTTATIATLLAGSAMPAFASTNASPSTLRQDSKEKKNEMRTDRQELRTEAAKNKSAALAKHCTAVETNLTNILTRIDSRIAKQKADGKDVSAAEAAVTDARTSLDSGKSYCDQAVAKFDSVPVDKWEAQKSVLAEARSLAKQSREMFVKARKSIGTAIKSLMANGKKMKASPTPTSSTNQ